MKKTLLTLISFYIALSNCYAEANTNTTALVIIDMQREFLRIDKVTHPEESIKFRQQLIDSQILMVNEAKLRNLPIIIFEYVHPFCDAYDGTKYADCGPTESRLLAATANYKKLKILKKTTDSFFDEKNNFRDLTINYLKEQNIGNLILMGVNARDCVQDSMIGAIVNGYDVIAYTLGMADFNTLVPSHPDPDDYNYSPKYTADRFHRKLIVATELSQVTQVLDLK
ncbi:MAG: isochorismatase family protein [Pseudobdellovibrionaceae bacterium]